MLSNNNILEFEAKGRNEPSPLIGCFD